MTEKSKLTVWCGSMPESNGRSNFTAVLMRKGEPLLDGLTEGHTIARSEYPDRVRYEADCVRHLIGELAERPVMWDEGYDFDKHSGYEAPPRERELAIAKAAAEACYNASHSGGRKAYCDLGLDFNAIVQGVK